MLKNLTILVQTSLEECTKILRIFMILQTESLHFMCKCKPFRHEESKTAVTKRHRSFKEKYSAYVYPCVGPEKVLIIWYLFYVSSVLYCMHAFIIGPLRHPSYSNSNFHDINPCYYKENCITYVFQLLL